MNKDQQEKSKSLHLKWLIIYGPTAVGKTDLAISLAQRLGGAMINADMGQAYTPLAIGTAKPVRAQLPVEHHLFDIVNEPRDMTVTEYRTRVIDLLDTLESRNVPGIITGGSGFYLSSLFFPPRGGQEIEHALPEDDPSATWDDLHTIDPVRAAQIHAHDTYRIKRALAIWRRTGRQPSHLEPQYAPLPGKAALVIVTRSRQELYSRINERAALMLKNGWIEEVKGLPEEWQTYLLKKKLLGYDDIVRFVRQADQSAANYQWLIDTIAQKTRQYAKRQITFGNFLARKLHTADPTVPVISVDLSSLSMDEAVTYIEGKLSCS
jgi:tRNA dimethylallyltransferase